MDALVELALERVKEATGAIDLDAVDPEPDIARAIHAVDALKSALKTLKAHKHSTLAEQLRDPEVRAQYVRVSQPDNLLKK